MRMNGYLNVIRILTTKDLITTRTLDEINLQNHSRLYLYDCSLKLRNVSECQFEIQYELLIFSTCRYK